MKNNLNIDNGDEICKECNGERYITIIVPKYYSVPEFHVCFLCGGKGKVSWIDIIKGKNKKMLDGRYETVYRKHKGKWYYEV